MRQNYPGTRSSCADSPLQSGSSRTASGGVRGWSAALSIPRGRVGRHIKRRNMVVHVDNIFAGFGQARMEVLVVQEKGSRLWRQYQSSVGAPGYLAGALIEQEHEIVFGPRFVDAFTVQVRVPFVAGALSGEQAGVVGRTFEHVDAICIGAGRLADIG